MQLEFTYQKKIATKVVVAVHKLLMHFGSDKMSHFIRDNFILTNTDRICRKVAKSCNICQRAKIYTRRTEESWNFEIPKSVGNTIFLDLFGPLPVTNTGKKYVILAIDQFSRKVPMTATQDRTARSTVKATKRLINGKFPECKCIVTDNAKEFHSVEWSSFGKDFKIVQRSTSPYCPQSNPAERVMKELLARIMRSYTYFDHTKWESLLPRIEKTFNSTRHSTTQETPYNLTNEKSIEIPSKLGKVEDTSNVSQKN